MLELALLTLINLFNYLDRFILLALSPTIKTALSLSDTEVGFLASAFMFTYFLCSPAFGWLGDRGHRYRLMGVGVGLWSLATAATGFATQFVSLLFSRFFVGLGEAAYGTISPAVISDLFPKEKRGRAFAIFFMALPVGSALGFLLGGLLEHLVGWRHAFFTVGVPGLLLAAALMFLRDPERGRYDDAEDRAQKALPLLQIYRAFAHNHEYVLTVLGYCAYTFVVGGVAVWIPHYLQRYIGVEPSRGNMIFGGVTVVAGFLGTIAGGAWADAWSKRSGDAFLKLSALSMFAAAPIYLLLLQFRSLPAFCALCFVLEFLLFLSTSPVNAQIVNCVPVRMRASASAVAIFMIHLFGDAVSPPLVGFVSDHSNLLSAMYLFAVGIVVSGMIWAAKVVLYWETMPWPVEALGGEGVPRFQQHRGLHGKEYGAGVQENTLEAFRAAKRSGARMIELDVRLSSDGVPVVIHDADIQRVSEKEGHVAALSAEELKMKAHAPSLEEVLRDRGVPDFVNIELKSDVTKGDGLEEAVAAAVRRAEAEKRVLFSSFNPLALRRISRHLPSVPRALLVTEERTKKNKIYLRKLWLAALARPHLVHLEKGMYTERKAREYESRGVKCAVWTVNSPEEAKKLLARGALSIISDNPSIANL